MTTTRLASRPAAHGLGGGLAVLMQAGARGAGGAGPTQPPAPAPAPLAAVAAPITPRAFKCRCGRPVFFGNSECLACQAPLGYAATLRQLLPLQPALPAGQGAGARVAGPGAAAPALWWQAVAADATSPRYRRCANLHTAAACNWLVAEGDAASGEPPLCRCCRLTRTLPDLSQANNPLRWNRIEQAKRRLVSSLIGLQLPVVPKSEDAEHGLAFDFLQAAPGCAVTTGHADGVITIDVEEVDDAGREQRRVSLDEPYRTLLGHLRHESGHYYWQRLVETGPWLPAWRGLYGDERQPYAEALDRHYRNGPQADWNASFVSAYASSHPWEDWAETWAHYLHLIDTLDTARSFGLDGERLALHYERFGPDVLGADDAGEAPTFLRLINGWMELTGVLNELSRSMGMPDFYPFVLSAPVVRKLYFVHRVIDDAAAAARP
jgi:hypothetical protein